LLQVAAIRWRQAAGAVNEDGSSKSFLNFPGRGGGAADGCRSSLPLRSPRFSDLVLQGDPSANVVFALKLPLSRALDGTLLLNFRIKVNDAGVPKLSLFLADFV
jgi:hypothetical protein